MTILAVGTPEEWVWVGLTIVTLITNSWGLISAIKDKEVFLERWSEKYNGAGLIIANSAVRREALRVAMGLCLGVLTVSSLFTPNAPISVLVILIRVFVSIVFILMAAQSILDRISRHKVIEQLDKEQAKWHSTTDG